MEGVTMTIKDLPIVSKGIKTDWELIAREGFLVYVMSSSREPSLGT